MTPEEIGTLIIRLQGDGSSYQRMLQQAQVQTKAVARSAEDSSNSLQSMGFGVRRWALSAIGALTPILGVMSLIGGAFKGVRLAADMEQMSISFKVLTGDAKLAEKTLKDLTRFADLTPFEPPEVIAAAKQMMAFGESAENIVPTLQSLGDVASGLNIPIGQLVYLFGTLKSQGVATTVDINQFAMRGIPIWKELEKQMGKTNAELRDMLRDRRITFEDVERAFKTMTGPGGKFFDLMKEQSQSVTGLFSTMKGDIDSFFRTIGENIIEVFRLKDVMKAISEAARDLTNVIKLLPPEWKKWVSIVAASTVAIIALTLAFPLLRAAFSMLDNVFRAIVIDLVLTNALLVVQKVLWLAWSAVVLSAKATLFLFNAQLVLYKGLIVVATALTQLWAGGSAIATAATWLWNAALVVLNSLLAPAAIIAGVLAFMGTVAALAVVLVAAGAAVWGVYQAGRALFDVLKGFPVTTGPLAQIGGMFKEWFNILMSVVRAARTNLPIAWEILSEGFRLAVIQIRNLWPPLWNFILKGFSILWELISGTSGLQSFLEAVEGGFVYVGNVASLAFASIIVMLDSLLQQATLGFLKLGKTVGSAFSIDTTEIDAELTKMNDAVDSARESGVRLAKLRLEAALRDFKIPVDAEEQRIRQNIQGLLDMLKGIDEKAAAAGSKPPPAIPPLKADLKLIPKFDAAETGSVEAISRVIEARDKSLMEREGGVKGRGRDAHDAVAFGSPEALERQRQDNMALKEIALNTRNIAKKPTVDLELAGIV